MSKRHFRGRSRLLLFAVPVLAVAVYFSFPWWLPWFGVWLVDAQPPVKAEIGVVLAGDFYGLRVLRGASLVREGFVPKVLVSGAPGVFSFYESDLAVQFAVKEGFPEASLEAFHTDHHSTQEEAHIIGKELRRRGIRSALIVTSDFHTRRAGRIWRYTVPWLEQRMVSSNDRFFRRPAWWRGRESAKRVSDEWMKLAAFTFDFFPPPEWAPVP
ncbi:MAG: YdcF family protein [Bryobacterales bacterium]|nr:YdcF family protein [Bryobacterales bacterium]